MLRTRRGVVTVAVEGEHRVDQMLHGAGPGQIAVLGHVADQEQRGAGDFAMRVRRSTHVRTCARLPAGWPSSGSDTDWSESTTTSAGRCRSTAASIASTSGPRGQEVPGHQADARRPTPDLRQRLLSRGQHDVDPGRRQRREHLEEQRRLADAGGPNSNVTEPATTPPPMTRSSSLTPVANGCMASVETSASARAGGPAGRHAEPGRRAGAGPSVFHSPQAGQRPAQRNEVAVHAEHRKAPSPRGGERGAVAMA